MPKLSGRKIITNRQLNFTLSPVDLHNPKEMPYSLPDYQIDGTWNQYQSIVLDVLLDRIFKGNYGEYKNFPKSWRSKSVIEENKNFVGVLFNPTILTYLSNKPIEAFSIQSGYDVKANERKNYENSHNAEDQKTSFDNYFNAFLQNNDSYQTFMTEMNKKVSLFNGNVIYRFIIPNLYKNYPILRQYKHKVPEYVQRIAETKFKMNYKVKCLVRAPEYNDKGNRTHAGTLLNGFYEMQDFQQIFSVDFEEDLFKLNFKTPLGKMILHNTLILDTDWVPDEALTLSKNAYFIYKRFILNRVSGKNKPKELEIWFEDIKAFLDLNSGKNSGIYDVLDRAFKEMQKMGLIAGFSWNRNYTKQRQYRLIFDRPKKEFDKKKNSSDKLLKMPT